MLNIDELHTQAMDLAETAFQARRQGDYQTAKELFLKSLDLEQQAAALMPAEAEAEPTRSILYRSAAALAYHGGQYDLAEWLIAKGLSGYPPPEIKAELKKLYEEVNLRRNIEQLELNEVSEVVPIEVGLLSLMKKQAQLRGVKLETLVNLWLQQKLTEQMLA